MKWLLTDIVNYLTSRLSLWDHMSVVHVGSEL